MPNPHCSFWKEHPAFLTGLNLLIGTSSFLFFEFPWNWIFPLLWSFYLISLRSWSSILLLAGSFLYAFFLFYQSPVSTETKAYFSISSLQPHQTPFQKRLLYKGTLYINQAKLPCSISTRIENRPIADKNYVLSGTLQQKGAYQYAFKPKKWHPIDGSFSLAEMRYQAKESLRRLLEQKLPSPRTAALLSSLITGDVEDRSLRYEFSKIGLQHILAISGFHFGLLIAFCSFFLGLVLKSKWKFLALLVGVNAYFLFVGSSPAVQRSWLTASLYLCGKLMDRHSTGINLLGVALSIEILCDPLASSQIGFQLSFLSCLGILLFYPPFERSLRIYLPKRNFFESEDLTFPAKHGYLISALLRQSLSLTLSVNLAIFPLLLFHFHQFPWLSLLYNLFFPLFLSLALFFILLALLTHLLWPPAASLLFQAADFFTAQLLDLSAYPPLALDYSLRLVSFPAWPIPFYLFALFTLSIRLSDNYKYDIN